MVLVATVTLMRVVLIYLVLHVQMVMAMTDRMTMVMSDHRFLMQLAAPLCLDCHV
jgi:hypothetical protein